VLNIHFPIHIQEFISSTIYVLDQNFTPITQYRPRKILSKKEELVPNKTV